jgi:hypothetical protein
VNSFLTQSKSRESTAKSRESTAKSKKSRVDKCHQKQQSQNIFNTIYSRFVKIFLTIYSRSVTTAELRTFA